MNDFKRYLLENGHKLASGGKTYSANEMIKLVEEWQNEDVGTMRGKFEVCEVRYKKEHKLKARVEITDLEGCEGMRGDLICEGCFTWVELDEGGGVVKPKVGEYKYI